MNTRAEYIAAIRGLPAQLPNHFLPSTFYPQNT